MGPCDPEQPAYSSLPGAAISCKQATHPSWTQRRQVLSSQVAAPELFIGSSVSALKSRASVRNEPFRVRDKSLKGCRLPERQAEGATSAAGQIGGCAVDP